MPIVFAVGNEAEPRTKRADFYKFFCQKIGLDLAETS